MRGSKRGARKELLADSGYCGGGVRPRRQSMSTSQSMRVDVGVLSERPAAAAEGWSKSPLQRLAGLALTLESRPSEKPVASVSDRPTCA